jgi:hypothetical protein
VAAEAEGDAADVEEEVVAEEEVEQEQAQDGGDGE